MYGIKIIRNHELSLTRQICDHLRKLIENENLKCGFPHMPLNGFAVDIKTFSV